MSLDVSFLDSKIRFAALDEGQDQIATSDIYTQHLSDYELLAKIRTRGKATEQEYLSNCQLFVRSWTPDEVAYLNEIIATVERRIRELQLCFALPDVIVLIKTTGWEEGGANGYTRKNAIYLNAHSLSRNLFLHELFHIISRFNPEKATAAYALLGFTPIEEIDNDDPMRISNPDAPFLRHVVNVTWQSHPIQVALVIRGSRPYTGGSFFGYVEKKLLVVEKAGDGYCVQRVNGDPFMLNYHDVDNLYDRIGKNTGYNIHQEEISAVHFEQLILDIRNLPNQNLVDGLGEVLRKA